MKNKDSDIAKEFKERFILESTEIISKVSKVIQGKMFNSVIDSLAVIISRTIIDSFEEEEKVSQCGLAFVEKFMLTLPDFYKRREELRELRDGKL